MKTVLFIILPFPSHYNACLGLMQARQRQGFRVMATGTLALRKYLSQLMIEAVEVPFMQETIIQNGRVWLALWLQSRLNPTFIRQQYREILSTVRAIELLVRRLEPTAIYVDSTLSHYYFILLAIYPNKPILLNTRLSTRQVAGVPPFTAGWVAQNATWSRVKAVWEWSLYRLNAEWGRQLQRTAFDRLDNNLVLDKIAKKRGLKSPICWQRDNVGYPLPVGATEWILCPKVLEYPWVITASTEQYVYCPAERSTELFTDPLTNWLAGITENERLVYCSLGTLSDGRQVQIAIRFLQLVLATVQKIPNTKFIISAGALRDALPNQMPSNVFFADRVPQTALLPYCDAMITHGGMNSFKECIEAGVPMLVYPLNTQVDQPGNAARIVYHGLGLSGHAAHETEIGLQQKLLAILQKPVFKQQILVMQQQFVLAASTFSLLDLAESHKSINSH